MWVRRAAAIQRLAKRAPFLLDGLAIAGKKGGAEFGGQAESRLDQRQQGPSAKRCSFQYVRASECGRNIIARRDERTARQRREGRRSGWKCCQVPLEQRDLATNVAVREPVAKFVRCQDGFDRDMESPHFTDMRTVGADRFKARLEIDPLLQSLV